MNSKQPNIRYFIYARKSSESDEKQVQSIDDQMRVMKDLARDLDLNVVGTYSEARSAKEPHARPVFEELTSAIQAGKADGILTWKIDRLSRNPIDSATVQWLLQNGQIRSIQTAGREYLPEDNAVIFSIESSMANQYIRDLSKNVKRGLKYKLEKGIAPKLAPIGYLNTKTEVRGENYIIKDPDRFKIIRKAWNLMLSGNHSGPAILDILNNEYGLRTRKTRSTGGKPLSRSGLYRMFSDPFYAGQFLYNGVLYSGKHDAMVSRDEFDRVQDILGRPGKPQQNRHTYVYTGLLRCGECDGLISATHKEKTLKCTGTRKSYTLYYCIPARKGTYPCSQRRYINSDLIDAQVKAEIETFTIIPQFRDWALDIDRQRDIDDAKDLERIRASQRRALDNATHQLDKLTDMCTKRLLSDEDFTAKRAQLVGMTTTLKDNIRNFDMSVAQQQEFIEWAFNFATDAYEIFQNGTENERRTVFSTIRLNSTLEDKELALQKPFWLVSIQKQYPPIKRQMEALELRFGRDTKRYKEELTSLNPLVRALVDAVGAETTKQKICHGP
jgi:site-specific DNA recombinase